MIVFLLPLVSFKLLFELRKDLLQGHKVLCQCSDLLLQQGNREYKDSSISNPIHSFSTIGVWDVQNL